MARTFATPPSGGYPASEAAIHLTAAPSGQAELQQARENAAGHPKKVWGWRPKPGWDLYTHEHTQEPAEVPHPLWRKVDELETAKRLAQRREFFDKWCDGKIVALAKEPKLGADWSVVDLLLIWGWLFENLRNSFWENSRLKLPKKTGPECDLLFYSRDHFEKLSSSTSGGTSKSSASGEATGATSGGQKSSFKKKIKWHSEVMNELKRMETGKEIVYARVLQDDGYQKKIVESVHAKMVSIAAAANQQPPAASTVGTYVKEANAWGEVRKNAQKWAQQNPQ